MHYICPECGGVAEQPKVCETEGCSREGEPLQMCDCQDGQHHHESSTDEE